MIFLLFHYFLLFFFPYGTSTLLNHFVQNKHSEIMTKQLPSSKIFRLLHSINQSTIHRYENLSWYKRFRRTNFTSVKEALALQAGYSSAGQGAWNGRCLL